MKISRLYLILLLVINYNFSFAQKVYKGIINDKQTKIGIPFASIGSIKNKGVCMTDDKGVFILKLQTAETGDSIKIYAIGYKEILLSNSEFEAIKNGIFELEPMPQELTEIEIKAKKLFEKKLGVLKYDKLNCSGFIDFENNWKGVETAIRISNNENRYVRIKKFNFYIIKNNFKDSLTFRLNFYSANKYYPTRNILKKSIIFKTILKEGEVSINLQDYSIYASGDFYVSLECLMDKVSINDFCFAGEISEPSYVREGAFGKWKKIRGGGAAFNVDVSYTK